jgi:hypothetical protein
MKPSQALFRALTVDKPHFLCVISGVCRLFVSGGGGLWLLRRSELKAKSPPPPEANPIATTEVPMTEKN